MRKTENVAKCAQRVRTTVSERNAPTDDETRERARRVVDELCNENPIYEQQRTTATIGV